MAKKKQSKYGYGIHNVCKTKVTKKSINLILNKDWKDVASYDLYLLYGKGWKTEDIKNKFNVSLIKVLNRLRNS